MKTSYLPTQRTLGSKEQIWAEVDRTLRRRLAGMATRDISLPLPKRVEPETTGSNWYIEWSAHAKGQNALVLEVVEEIRIERLFAVAWQ